MYLSHVSYKTFSCVRNISLGIFIIFQPPSWPPAPATILSAMTLGWSWRLRSKSSSVRRPESWRWQKSEKRFWLKQVRAIFQRKRLWRRVLARKVWVDVHRKFFPANLCQALAFGQKHEGQQAPCCSSLTPIHLITGSELDLLHEPIIWAKLTRHQIYFHLLSL